MKQRLLGIIIVVGFVQHISPPCFALGSAVDPHEEVRQKYCALCHEYRTLEPQKPSPGHLPFDVNVLCNGCHDPNSSSHMVGMKFSPAIASPLPLSLKEEVDCETCHDSHNLSGNTLLLRLTFDQLCFICHKK